MVDASLLEQAIQASKDGIVITDARGEDNPIIFVNPGFERLTGYRAAEVLNQNCRFLQGTDSRQPQLDILREALRNGKPCVVTLRNYRKDGSMFWNELSLSPVHDRSGELTHFIAVQKDVTARALAEAELKESRNRLEEAMRLIEQANKSLEKRVAADTQELENARNEMREKEKLAAIGQFAAGIVHEIRSPLTTLSMTLDYMRGLTVPASGKKRLELAVDESIRLERLLGEILLYAKPHHLEMRELNLRDLAKTAIEVAAEMRSSSDCDIRLQSSPVPSILGDRDKLHEALLNLLCNACEASGKTDAVTVAVATSRQPNWVELSVHNWGKPIAEEHLSRLIEPFFTTKSSGTGLGLSIADRIIADHGGRILFYSSAERGTTVRVELPVAD
jgi:PAS domain S-box-containing protein